MHKRLLERLVAEPVVVTVILINTLAIVTMGFPAHRNDWRLLLIDWLCVFYFVVELILKMTLRGWRGYWSLGWNRFDLVVVLASAPLLIDPAGLLLEGLFLRLSVFRVARLLRVFRLLRFIPNAAHLWSGIRRALRASVGVLLAAAFYTFLLGLVAFYLFRDVGPAGEPSPYFANPMLSLYSIFQVFTVEGWYEIPGYIATHSSPTYAVFARCFFIFAVVTGGLLGLSLANAVFVDEMVMDNTEPLEQSVAHLREELAASHEEISAQLRQLTERLDRLAGAG